MTSARSVEKACPVILRSRRERLDILAFQHPIAGNQLVKGRLDEGEKACDAARRELAEESGLVAAAATHFIGRTSDLPDGNIWHFYLCKVDRPLPDRWDFFTADEGGLLFRFFWHPLGRALDDGWDPLFHEVVGFLQPRILDAAHRVPAFIH